jgi:uncharacterized protein (TIGR02246 family)
MPVFYASLVDGQLLEEGNCGSGEIRHVLSPYEGKSAGRLREADSALASRMMEAAEAVAQHARKQPAHRRSALCRTLSELITAHGDALAHLITAESGKPLLFSRAEVARAASTFALAAGEALRFPQGEVLPLDVSPGGEGYHGHAFRVPAGPVLGICPFNFPLNLVAHKVAPALAVGCPVVIKPAPQAPLTALRLAALFLEAARTTGSDPRLLQVADMPVSVAQELVSSPVFKVLSFTGSAKVGWALKAQCGEKRVTLELGGNAPVIVHADCDLNHAVQRCVLGAFGSAGQVCIKAQRILVHHQIYLRFRSAFLEKAAVVPVGDPSDPATVVGPVIDESNANRITEWVDEAVDGGARSLLTRRREGNVIWPVVLEDVPATARLAREEVFGPVVTLESYESFTEAIQRANSGRYGLQAGVFTHDINRAHQAAEDLEYGGVIINDVPMFRVDNFPYGGVKASGLGREGVRYAMEDMTEWRMMAHRHLQPPKIVPGSVTSTGGVVVEDGPANHHPEVAIHLGEIWAQAIAARDGALVASQYAPDAVLLATFRNTLNTPDGIRGYFEGLARRPGLRVEFNSMTAREFAPTVVSLYGLYTFNFEDENGEPVDVAARYDFIWENRYGKWLIVEHHSSVCPQDRL